MKISILAFSCILLFFSCSKKNNGEVVAPNCIIGTVTYSATIAGIINTNCIGCHGNNPSAGFSLNTYNALKVKVDEGRLLGAINHSPGFVPMPQGANKLSQCDINKIQAWVNAGALNN